MTTGWKKLTRRDLTTFDDFATDAVITAMQLGGVGRIQSNGHAKIRGTNGIITISRDTSGPHIRGNMMMNLKRAFPALKIDDSSKKDTTVTPVDFPVPEAMMACPAKGCELKFPNLGAVNDHVHKLHFICKWEGCDMGPDGGPFIGATRMSVAGHTNIRHKGNKPWEKNREKAAASRAATVAASKQARDAKQASPVVSLVGMTDVHGHPAVVAPVMPEQVTVPPTDDKTEASVQEAGAGSVVEESVAGGNDPDALAKLALIREILGDDTEVVALKKEVADLKAHLALVREAVGLDFGDDEK